MISNVQFCANPAKKIVGKAVDKAMESFEASRRNIDAELLQKISEKNQKLIKVCEDSAAAARRPSDIVNPEQIDQTMLERIESFALSHGNVDAEVTPKSVGYLRSIDYMA